MRKVSLYITYIFLMVKIVTFFNFTFTHSLVSWKFVPEGYRGITNIIHYFFLNFICHLFQCLCQLIMCPGYLAKGMSLWVTGKRAWLLPRRCGFNPCPGALHLATLYFNYTTILYILLYYYTVIMLTTVCHNNSDVAFSYS